MNFEKYLINEAGMTKKHFIEIARILKQDKANTSLIFDLADYFKSINPLFNKDKFIEAAK